MQPAKQSAWLRCHLTFCIYTNLDCGTADCFYCCGHGSLTPVAQDAHRKLKTKQPDTCLLYLLSEAPRSDTTHVSTCKAHVAPQTLLKCVRQRAEFSFCLLDFRGITSQCWALSAVSERRNNPKFGNGVGVTLCRIRYTMSRIEIATHLLASSQVASHVTTRIGQREFFMQPLHSCVSRLFRDKNKV